MQIIDFDARFTEVLNDWIEKNRSRYKRPEDMEDDVPDVYLRWLNQPAEWLDGAAPGAYFERYNSADELCALLCEYIAQGVPVPDPLLDRLEELGDEKALLALAKDKAAPCEARMAAIELLRQLESTLPMVDFIRWQVERDEEDDLLDNALLGSLFNNFSFLSFGSFLFLAAVAQTFAQVLYGLTKSGTKFRKILRSEDKQSNNKNNDPFKAFRQKRHVRSFHRGVRFS